MNTSDNNNLTDILDHILSNKKHNKYNYFIDVINQM